MTQVSDPSVRMEGRGPADRPPPKPAKGPPLELVVTMEKMIADEEEGDFVRIVAVKCCCQVHGCLRFRDFQTAEEFKEAPNTLLARLFMKKQGWRSWAAMKIGFSGVNWGSPFMVLLQKHGMPCEDYVLKRPQPNLKGF